MTFRDTLKQLGRTGVVILPTWFILDGLNPFADILQAGGTAGVEVTVIVMGALITFTLLRTLSGFTKSMETRIDALIEANREFTKVALSTMETIASLRQSAAHEEVEDILRAIADSRQDLIHRIQVLANKGEIQ